MRVCIVACRRDTIPAADGGRISGDPMTFKLVCLLVFLGGLVRVGVAQGTLEVISSVPAPAEIFGRSGWQPSIVGCGAVLLAATGA